MSYILDALKKIEHEKHKKAGPDGRINITGDLFHERRRTAGRSGTWKMPALLAAVVLIACAGTWFVLRGGGRKSHTIVRPDVSARTVTAKPPVLPIPVSVQPPPVQPVPAPATPRLSAEARQNQKADVPPRTSRGVLKKEMPRRSPSSVPKQAVPSVQPPADLKLSGIAWQDEHAGRRAVINGFLLKEGAVVSGAKITDIQADRVRFSTPAGVFEVRLDAVLPAEAKK